jgi:2'-5' RNA ligase
VPGHSVLVVPVPVLEPFVRERHEFYDGAWVSDDPAFTHAHITALGPFLPDLDDAAAATLARIAATTTPFDVALTRLDTFANGVIHLVPEPDLPFRDLTARLLEEFPECPPYGNQFPDTRPHLTLDRTSEEVTETSTRARLGDLVPFRFRAERLDLAWYEEGACRVLRSWPLGAR